MQTLKRCLQSTLKRAGVYYRLKNSYVYDLYWTVADRRLIDGRSKELDFYRSLLNGFRRGDLIFDVGANVGDKTDLFLRLGTRVVSIEPDEANQEVLRDRFLRYRLAPKRVVIVGKAVSFDYNGISFPIKVSQAPSAPINGVVPMIATVPSSFSLPFGTVGNVSYKVSIASGILVPLNALVTLENQNYVFKVADGKVLTQNVTILGEAGITTAVAGLQAGDVVVVNPPPGLIQGSQVQAVMLPTATGSSQSAGKP